MTSPYFSSSSLPPVQPILPPNTIVPENEDLFVSYFNRLYEDIAEAVNSKDPKFYPMAITSTAQNILNCPEYGAFILCVSGVDSTLPALTASLCKSDRLAAGVINVIGFQAGTGAWAGNVLTITNGPTGGGMPSYFQIAHDRTGISGNFNLRLMGTQEL